MKPLDVKTKFYNAESEDVYLEVRILRQGQLFDGDVQPSEFPVNGGLTHILARPESTNIVVTSTA
jgi:hypothetical protein